VATPGRRENRMLSRIFLIFLPPPSSSLTSIVCGFALLPVSGGFGVTANVFAERAKEMGGSTESLRMILGNLMAHELGHLLLGQSGHSVAGIMRAQWRTQELQRAVEGTLFFLPEQAQTIRAQVLARMINSGTLPAHR